MIKKCWIVIGLHSCYGDLIDGNYGAVSGLLARKMAAVETKTSKVPTGLRLLLYSLFCDYNDNSM